MRKMGVKTVMVTGDNPLTAKYIADKAGVDDFIAEAKPEDKMTYIKKEQQGGRTVYSDFQWSASYCGHRAD